LSKPSPKNTHQCNFLFADLIDQLNPKHPLLKLSGHIDWSVFEDEFSGLYSHLGKPSKQIRLMVGLSILKHMENLSDEVLVQRWVQNPYYQAFTGETEFQWQFPCDPSSLTNFRKRIGRGGHEKILAVSIALHQEKAFEHKCRYLVYGLLPACKTFLMRMTGTGLLSYPPRGLPSGRIRPVNGVLTPGLDEMRAYCPYRDIGMGCLRGSQVFNTPV